MTIEKNMQIETQIDKGCAEITGKWLSAILNIADKYGIDRNLLVKRGVNGLLTSSIVVDFTKLDISTIIAKTKLQDG